MTATASPALDFASSPINQSLSAEQKIGLLTQMIRIRRFEQAALKYYQGGKIGGFLHLYIGQEAVAVGTISLGGADDHFITAYRDHGHALAVGMGMNECMAEMYGKQSGCSKGKGGSMHFFAPDKNFWGGHGIVAGQTPLGLGLAYGLKYLGREGCCLCYLGDGAVNQGAFHESLNLAALFDIPVVYVIENNGYSMGTSQARSSAGELAQRAAGYDMQWGQCSGHDVYEVRAMMDKFLTLARETGKPSTVEIDTYRYRGHSVADPDNTYRSKQEIEEYRRTRDPIQLFQDKLLAEGVLTAATAEQIDTEARAEADVAADFSEASPFPTPADIQTDVYWEADNPSDRRSQGRLFFT